MNMQNDDMKSGKTMLIAFSAAVLASCAPKEGTDSFHYLMEEFADLKIIRYRIPGWEQLSLQQKEYAYHLSEAAKYGRDITWDQYCRYNLPIRKVLETILSDASVDRTAPDWPAFETYAKRVFFSNGVHHHYAEDKFVPSCPKAYFAALMEKSGCADAALLDFIYDPQALPQRRSTSRDGDIVALSAVNFYEGVSRAEVEQFYAAQADPNDPEPISYGLNTKVVKGPDGVVKEIPWKEGGLYGAAIEKICGELALAREVAENDIQKKALGLLIDYYRTGDLELWDAFNVEWVKDTLGTVDFINGFIEDYDDPLGRKATWEGYVHIKDVAASARTETGPFARGSAFPEESRQGRFGQGGECRVSGGRLLSVHTDRHQSAQCGLDSQGARLQECDHRQYHPCVCVRGHGIAQQYPCGIRLVPGGN